VTRRTTKKPHGGPVQPEAWKTLWVRESTKNAFKRACHSRGIKVQWAADEVIRARLEEWSGHHN
jgi:hypothetical protein